MREREREREKGFVKTASEPPQTERRDKQKTDNVRYEKRKPKAVRQHQREKKEKKRKEKKRRTEGGVKYGKIYCVGTWREL